MDSTILKVKDDNSNAIKHHTVTDDTTQNTNLYNLNTYQYLAQLWQNSQTTTVPPQPANSQLTPQQEMQLQRKQAKGLVVVRTSTKSSISSSSESARNKQATNTTQPHQTLHNTFDTTTKSTYTTTTTTTTSTLLKSLSKQFQYFLKLLQENNNNNSRNNRFSNNNKQNYNRQTILPSKPYSNSLHNAASEDNGQHQLGADDDADENEDGDDEGENEGNGGEENDESNETIEKLKRKLSQPLTTKSLQLQQQQQQQQLPTTGLPLSTSYLATVTPRYGSKSTSTANGRNNLATATYFDNYFRVKQNPNNSHFKPAITADNKSQLKLIENKEKLHNSEEEQQQNVEDKSSVNTFEAQFLKRTPANSQPNDDDNDNYSSSSLNTNNPYFITKTTISKASKTRSNNNNNKHRQQPPIQTILATPAATQPQTSPLYVTNYIGDNTQQRLTTIRQQQQHLHHQQEQQQQDITATTSLQQQFKSSTTQQPPPPPPLPNQQFESFHLFSSTTRRPKIKTQKLIRRLRTQIK